MSNRIFLFQVHGIWQNMIEEHREMLRSSELKVSLSFLDDPDAESQLTGVVHRHNNKSKHFYEYILFVNTNFATSFQTK